MTEYYQNTRKCIKKGCDNNATTWNGFLLKSRYRVGAGLCEDHKGAPEGNSFDKKGCRGVYDKSYGIVGEANFALFETGTIE